MATCPYCNKSSWFLSLTKDGVCKDCLPIVALNVSSLANVITSSEEVIESSKNISTKLSRCQVILKRLEDLAPYESKGITTISPPPSALIQIYKKKYDQIILDEIKDKLEEAEQKSQVATSYKTKEAFYQKVISKIYELKGDLTDKSLLDNFELKTKIAINRIKLEGFVDEAKKAEFKGRKKKALDQYLEALYLVRNDQFDDKKQANIIAFLEKKIKELQEEGKENK